MLYIVDIYYLSLYIETETERHRERDRESERQGICQGAKKTDKGPAFREFMVTGLGTAHKQGNK